MVLYANEENSAEASLLGIATNRSLSPNYLTRKANLEQNLKTKEKSPFHRYVNSPASKNTTRHGDGIYESELSRIRSTSPTPIRRENTYDRTASEKRIFGNIKRAREKNALSGKNAIPITFGRKIKQTVLKSSKKTMSGGIHVSLDEDNWNSVLISRERTAQSVDNVFASPDHFSKEEAIRLKGFVDCAASTNTSKKKCENLMYEKNIRLMNNKSASKTPYFRKFDCMTSENKNTEILKKNYSRNVDCSREDLNPNPFLDIQSYLDNETMKKPNPISDERNAKFSDSSIDERNIKFPKNTPMPPNDFLRKITFERTASKLKSNLQERVCSENIKCIQDTEITEQPNEEQDMDAENMDGKISNSISKMRKLGLKCSKVVKKKSLKKIESVTSLQSNQHIEVQVSDKSPELESCVKESPLQSPESIRNSIEETEDVSDTDDSIFGDILAWGASSFSNGMTEFDKWKISSEAETNPEMKKEEPSAMLTNDKIHTNDYIIGNILPFPSDTKENEHAARLASTRLGKNTSDSHVRVERKETSLGNSLVSETKINKEMENEVEPSTMVMPSVMVLHDQVHYDVTGSFNTSSILKETEEELQYDYHPPSMEITAENDDIGIGIDEISLEEFSLESSKDTEKKFQQDKIKDAISCAFLIYDNVHVGCQKVSNSFQYLQVYIGKHYELTFDVGSAKHPDFYSYFTHVLKDLVETLSEGNDLVFDAFFSVDPPRKEPSKELVSKTSDVSSVKKLVAENKSNEEPVMAETKPNEKPVSTILDDSSKKIVVNKSLDEREILPSCTNLIVSNKQICMNGHNVFSLAVLTSAGGRTLIATDGNRDEDAISVWDLETNKVIVTFVGHSEAIYGLVAAKSVNGEQRLVSGGDDRTIKLWDVKTKKIVVSIDVEYRVRALCSFTLGDGEAYVAVGLRENNSIQLWNITSFAKLGNLEGHSGGVFCLETFTNSDGSTCLASGSDDGTIKIWNLSTAAPLCTLNNHLSIRVTALSAYMDSDGSIGLACGYNNGRVELWDINNATLKAILEEDRGYYVSSFAILSQQAGGICLAYGDKDGTIQVWDVEGQLLLAPLRGTEMLAPLRGTEKSWIENVAVVPCKEGREGLVSCDGTASVHYWKESTDRV